MKHDRKERLFPVLDQDSSVINVLSPGASTSKVSPWPRGTKKDRLKG